MGPVTSPPSLSPFRLRLALALGVALAACKPGIGDQCKTSTDCSQLGDRLCDISQPGGYCTIFNCEPGSSNAGTSCPNDSACVAFGVEPSPVDGCATSLGATPYQRTFCMKKCDNSNDCRSGYVCLDLAQDKRWKAVDVDRPGKVCTVATSYPAPVAAPGGDQPGDVATGVCTGTSSDAPEPTESAGGAGSTPGGAGASSGGAAGAN